MSSLVLNSISKRFFLVHFMNSPKYLIRWTALLFITLLIFLQYSLVYSRFLVLQRYYILIFFSIFLMMSDSNISKYLLYSSSLSVLIFLDLIVLLFLSFVHFRFLELVGHIFLCQIPLLCPNYQFTLTELVFLFLFFFILANSLMSAIYVRL